MVDTIKMIPGLMSVGLVAKNVGWLSKPPKKKGLLGIGVENILGVSMIKATSSIVN